MDAIIGFLQNMASFFQTILDFILTLFEFVNMLVSGSLWLLKTLPSLVVQVTALFAYCPPFVGIFLTGSLSIIVLYAIFKLI